MGLTLYRIPFSTNVERVALALAHKGVDVDWVDVDPDDRSPVVAISGQELVPVLVDGDRRPARLAGILELPRGALPGAAALPGRRRAPRGAAELPRLVQPASGSGRRT